MLSSKNLNAAGILADYMQGGVTDNGADVFAQLSNVHVYNPIINGVGYEQIVGALVGEAALNLDVNTCSVTNAAISAPAAQVGGVIGKSQTYTHIHACLFTGSAEGRVVGGITREISGGEPVYDCHVKADLYTNYTAGGVVGYSGRSKISNCVVKGTITLDEKATVGKVGGIVGEVATDATGTSTAILLENCLVGVSAIHVPDGKDVIAHRVVGFSSIDDYVYDEEKVVADKLIENGVPQSEWPRIYCYAPDKGFKNNYVYSALAGVDASIQLADNTTEGANLAWSEVTTAWLGEHGYKLGATVDAPWVKTGGLTLWFENDLPTDLENTWGNCGEVIGGSNQTTKKMLINGQLMLIRNGEIYNLVGARVR